jgi:hypothetical protein
VARSGSLHRYADGGKEPPAGWVLKMAKSKSVLIPRNAGQLLKMTESQKTELLAVLIDTLDELDCEDYFGTEGWRHRLLGED